jgi:hypothetical protein
MTEQQQFSFRQSKKDMAEIMEIATRLAHHRNKFRHAKRDDDAIALEASLLGSQWMVQARTNNPLRPLGSALDLARRILREKGLGAPR